MPYTAGDVVPLGCTLTDHALILHAASYLRGTSTTFQIMCTRGHACMQGESFNFFLVGRRVVDSPALSAMGAKEPSRRASKGATRADALPIRTLGVAGFMLMIAVATAIWLSWEQRWAVHLNSHAHALLYLHLSPQELSVWQCVPAAQCGYSNARTAHQRSTAIA